ncbi:MAG: hypothetical protein JW716_01110 [Candidatus Aenigmarchaeota archaeon]|nr:hypothetical protein [Candidatus Aenigmarchaeota archaeon]
MYGKDIMNGKRSLLTFSALFMFIILSVTLVAAQGQPQIPYSLYGKATLNGDPLPAGSVITAVINGKEVGILPTVIAGKYGGPTLKEGKLYVMEGTGTTIEFYVKAPDMHSQIKSIQTATWKSAEIDELNLDFTGQDMVAYFYGNAMIDDDSVPVNSVITAEIAGVVKGSITVQESGKYGSSSGEKLHIYDGINGDEINFFIKLPNATTKVEAEQKAAWQQGSTTELNLVFNGNETEADKICSFFGEALFNGTVAPVGSIITAEINNVVKGSITVLVQGKYGSLEDGKLDVYNGENGDNIMFFIKVPGYSNKIQATTTSTWIEERVRDFDLIFNPPASMNAVTDVGSQADSSDQGNDNSVPAITEGPDEKEIPALEELMDEENEAEIQMKKGDTISVDVAGKEYEIILKSTSDFGILLSVEGGQDFVIGKGETKSIDLNGDGVYDIEITLEKIKDGVATLTFIKLEQELTNAEGLVGMVTSNLGNNSIVAIGALVVIIVFIVGVLTYRRKGRRLNEGNYKKSFSF